MNNHTANSTFASQEFEEIFKEKSNLVCFDCSKAAASWASVNNSIYLCLYCAGIHRGFGVSVSYMRSVTIDTWNNTQLNYMKIGGNKRLKELLSIFEIPKTTPQEVLYTSNLLEYHRNQIKSEINNGKQCYPPKLEEALLPAVIISNNSKISYESNKINSLVSTPSKSSQNSRVSSPLRNFKYVPLYTIAPLDKKSGLYSSVGSVINSAVAIGKIVANGIKDRVGKIEITNKLYNTGSYIVGRLNETCTLVKYKSFKTVEAIKDNCYKVVTKGYKVAVKLKFNV
jgi:hypothetical protein